MPKWVLQRERGNKLSDWVLFFLWSLCTLCFTLWSNWWTTKINENQSLQGMRTTRMWWALSKPTPQCQAQMCPQKDMWNLECYDMIDPSVIRRRLLFETQSFDKITVWTQIFIITSDFQILIITVFIQNFRNYNFYPDFKKLLIDS